MRYLPDSNAIITPFEAGGLGSLTLGLQLRYPAFIRGPAEALDWLEDWFTRGFKAGHLVGSEDLLDEVGRKKDPASRLLRSLDSRGLVRILRPTPGTFTYIADIERFVRAYFEPHQADDFLRSADPMFIALAKTHEATLVTVERQYIPQYDGKTRRISGKPRIPFLAWVFNVRCISFYEALQELP